MKATILTATILLLSSFTLVKALLTDIPEGGFGMKSGDEITVFTTVKGKVKAGTSVGNVSSLKIADTTHIAELNKDVKPVFYARVYEGNRTCPFSIVKMDKGEKGYEASSSYGELAKEQKYVVSIPYVMKMEDKAKHLYSIVPNTNLEPGVYALCFHMTDGKKFIPGMDNIGGNSVLIRVK